MPQIRPISDLLNDSEHSIGVLGHYPYSHSVIYPLDRWKVNLASFLSTTISSSIQ